METSAKKVRVWYEIFDDGLPIRCSSCGKFGKPVDFVYVEQPGIRDILIHRKCITEEWLANNPQGEGLKKRTAHRMWWTRKFALKLVKK